MAKQCVNTCCGCCTLETGGYIIGWINIIFGTIGFVGSILLLAGASAALNAGGLTAVEEALLISIIIVSAIYICFTLVYTIAGILLVLGVKKRNHKLILMMLIIMGIGVIISFVSLFANAAVGTIVFSVLAACLQVYFFVCIFSLYAMIKNENSGVAGKEAY